ncbi:hypothetical protein RB195_004536 [Necator americanus]|uniref:ShKT domain-containing protein n=1 Tax=Necator americanus TaxID=51031 RepID=A0ABR1BIG9_NECAM
MATYTVSSHFYICSDNMFLYLLTILLLLNAFTQDVVLAQDCVDRVPTAVCENIKRKHDCKGPMEMIAQMQCPKTCNLC